MSGGVVGRYSSSTYFVVVPAVLGPVAALLFVVAVYLCRRRQCHDDPTTSTSRKHAPAARRRDPPSPATRLTPAAEQRHCRAAGSRSRGLAEVGINEETDMMLPVGAAAAAAGLRVRPSPLHVPGTSTFISVSDLPRRLFGHSPHSTLDLLYCRYVTFVHIRSFHSTHNVVDRGVLRAMWEELAGKVVRRDYSVSANHACLKNALFMHACFSAR